MGDDDGCFESALAAVRRFGGVLEHPEASHAWKWFGLDRPSKSGGWIVADAVGGFTCCVEQGHYGHLARKATWLYTVGIHPADLLGRLTWGPSTTGVRLDHGYHSAEERKLAVEAGAHKPRRRLSRKQNLATPTPFRDLLLSMAASVRLFP